ncbi:hypothetical protein MNB_ARC-1_735 [hydrothermal vent metagenome]|uniref:DUF4395 domain-containing protein n=1 Tax=hydrothermal vent metagenome TaxID=652676 RepID=A0A3B1EA60_9ZZZZ
MAKIFEFGQKIDKYDFKVVNERDARASAGIMFLLGTITLFAFLMSRNLFWANLFTITFILEFFIRIFINPRFAPYMLLGSLIVSNQEPDWVEASPKKFAWILGVILGAIMTYFIVFNIMTPARMITCLLCLFLLYMESVFGICLGCIIYKRLNIKLYKCPGGVCEVPQKNKNLLSKFVLVALYLVLFYGLFYGLKTYKYDGYTSSLITQAQKDAMEFGNMDDENEDNNNEVINKNNDCDAPQWAIDMGHEDMWLKHHGCQ